MTETTTSLGAIRGTVKHGIERYLGIRYAEPPIGLRRYDPPVPSGRWEGTYDATSYGNRAIQPPSAGILGPPGPGEPDEDCLFLNVFTPKADDGNRPVMVWIHGGGFTTGSGNDYDPTALVRQGDVVVVTLNYRLGIFGFLDLLSLGDEFAGSASNGFRDQITALEWVREHIADFGGDPGNVTIFGESAGGGSVLALLAAPSADGLFHRAIAHSPGGVNTGPAEFLIPLAKAVDGTADVLNRLRGAGTAELLAAQTAIAFTGGDVDGIVVQRHPTEAAADRNIPLVLGTNHDEGTLFSAIMQPMPGVFPVVTRGVARQVMRGTHPDAYLAALEDAYPDDDETANLERVWVDLFRRTSIETAAAATAGGAGGWLYRFDVPTTVFGGRLGATHAAEIAFTFNWFADEASGLMMHDPDDASCADLARKWSDTLISFARTGNPNGAGLPDWPHYAADDRRCLVLDTESRVETDPDAEHRKIWQNA